MLKAVRCTLYRLADARHSNEQRQKLDFFFGSFFSCGWSRDLAACPTGSYTGNSCNNKKLSRCWHSATCEQLDTTDSEHDLGSVTLDTNSTYSERDFEQFRITGYYDQVDVGMQATKTLTYPVVPIFNFFFAQRNHNPLTLQTDEWMSFMQPMHANRV